MNLFALKYSLERDFLPFARQELLGLPKDRLGVYAFWLVDDADDIQDCLYVGISTTCVRRRLLSHLSNESNEGLRRQFRMFGDSVRFTVAYTDAPEQTRELEAALIQDWQSAHNSQHRRDLRH